jgi:cobalt-zinc-cadmium efflux system outer membrane protein
MPLTLAEALRLAAERSPRLAAFDHARRRARAGAELDALSPPMTLDLQLENFAGTGAASGADALEATLQLSRVIELGGKAALRRAVGESQLATLDLRQSAERLDALADVSRRFVHVFADQENLEAARRSVRLAEDTVAAVRARVEAGAASPAAQSRAQIALARATIELEHAEHELESSRVLLAAAWGERRPTFPRVSGGFRVYREPESLDAYLARLLESPELLRFASEERLIAARQRLATAQRRASPTVNLGVRRLESLGGQALVAGFSMPLGAPRRASLESVALAGERAELEHMRDARRLELEAMLFGLYQEVVHARMEAMTIAGSIRPQAERMLRTVDEGYRSGRFSLIELVDAQRQLLDIEQDEIRAARDFHDNLIEIERLTGIGVESSNQGESP